MAVVEKSFLAGGRYARNQLFCRNALIAWSHSRRFQLARQLAEPYAGRRLLDYGCGDGTFLALVHDLFPEAVGADVDPRQTADCARRFASLPGTSFVLTDVLASQRHTGAFDLVTCMEVLEHCLEVELGSVLANLHRLVAPGGTIIFSVPIEIGPSLIIKQLTRALAGRRGLGDYQYREKYRLREFGKMILARAETTIARPVFRGDFATDRPHFFHGHKGFNWRALRVRLERDFVIRETRFSPLGWLRGLVSSQAWIICTPRGAK